MQLTVEGLEEKFAVYWMDVFKIKNLFPARQTIFIWILGLEH